MPPVPRISSTRQPASSDPMGRSAIRVHCDAGSARSYALLRVEAVDEPPELVGLDRLLPALELVARAPDEDDREAAGADAVEVAQRERVEALGDVDDDDVAAGGGGRVEGERVELLAALRVGGRREHHDAPRVAGHGGQRTRQVNRSSSRARRSACAPGPSSSVTWRSRPRTTTAGSRESLWRTRSAAAAAWSATAIHVAPSYRPAPSRRPRQSSSGRRPATPIATSAWPLRHARPNESATTTAGRAGSAARSALALASGSRGRRTSVSGAGAFEASTPALAQTKPWWVRAMITPRSARTIALDSSSTTC